MLLYGVFPNAKALPGRLTIEVNKPQIRSNIRGESRRKNLGKNLCRSVLASSAICLEAISRAKSENCSAKHDRLQFPPWLNRRGSPVAPYQQRGRANLYPHKGLSICMLITIRPARWLRQLHASATWRETKLEPRSKLCSPPRFHSIGKITIKVWAAD